MSPGQRVAVLQIYRSAGRHLSSIEDQGRRAGVDWQHLMVRHDWPVMNAFTAGGSARKWSGRRVAWLAGVPAIATVLVFIPVMLRSPSTTEPLPGIWLPALILAAPIAAYLVSRRVGARLSVGLSLLAGLPQLPLMVLLSSASIWLDVQRGHLLAGSGEEAMSYGLGTIVATLAGIVLLILVSAAALLGGRRRT